MEQNLAMTAVEETLRASDGSAARFASAQVPVAASGDRVGDVRRALVGRRFDSASAVAVCADEILIGLVRIEDLLAADGDTTVEMVMDPNPPRLTAGIDEEQAAWRAVHRGESTLAVVDDDGELVGLVAPARLLGIALEKHAGDLARLGGYLHRTGDARATSEEPVARRFRHRLPWLALGLIGALLSAGIVGSFERILQAKILLASFLPGIVYMADAVGTQTETLMIRGLSVGVAIRKVARLEVLTGLLVGLALAVTFGVVGLVLWGEPSVVLTVSLALFAACSVATLVAMALPTLLQRLGFDPAFGSGPLATVVQDLLSIVIYLGLALVLTG